MAPHEQQHSVKYSGCLERKLTNTWAESHRVLHTTISREKHRSSRQWNRSSWFWASWLLKTLQVRTYIIILQYQGRSSLSCSRPQSIRSVFSFATGSISSLLSRKGRYRFVEKLWLQFHIFQVREFLIGICQQPVLCCWPLLQLWLTLLLYSQQTPLLWSAHIPPVQASEELRNGNHSKLCPFISVRSNLLALNGWLAEQLAQGHNP